MASSIFQKFKKRVSTRKSASLQGTSEFYLNDDHTVATTKFASTSNSRDGFHTNSNSKGSNLSNISNSTINKEPAYIDRIGGNINFSSNLSNISSSKIRKEPSYIDRVGGNINFSTAPRIDNLSPVRKKSSEVTIFWTQPRQGRNVRNRDNPIFVEEPVDFYEGHVAQEEAQHHTQGPLYEKGSRRSWVAPINSNIDVALSDLPRSRSLDTVYPFDYDYDRINLAQLKKRRQEQRNEGFQPEAASHFQTLNGIFVARENEKMNLENYSSDHNDNFDSGFQDFNEDLNSPEEEPIEVILARKLNESREMEDEMNSSTKLRSRYNKKRSSAILPNEISSNNFSNVTAFGSQPAISQSTFASFSTSTHQLTSETSHKTHKIESDHSPQTGRYMSEVVTIPRCGSQDLNKGSSVSEESIDRGTFRTVSVLFSDEESIQASKENLSYWASTESIGNDNHLENFTPTQIQERKHIQRSVDNVFMPDQSHSLDEAMGTDTDSQALETVSWSNVHIFSESETATETSTDLLTTDDTIRSVSDTESRHLPYGKFIYPHSKSSSLMNVSDISSNIPQQNKSSVMRLHTDDLFFKMEKTLSDLQTQLDSVLDSDPQDELHNPFSKNYNTFFRTRGSSDGSYFKHGNLSSKKRSISLTTLPSTVSNYHLASTQSRANHKSIRNTLKNNSNPGKQVFLKNNEQYFETHDQSLEPLAIAISNREVRLQPETNLFPDSSIEPPISQVSSEDVFLQPEAFINNGSDSFASQSLEQLAPNENSSSQGILEEKIPEQWFPVSNVDVSIDNPDDPSSIMVSIDEESEKQDEEDVSAYLNVDGPVNIRKASGVTLLRRESSVYRVPKKKKAYVDVLVENYNNVYPDRACKRTIMQLMVRCYNFGNDCEWTGELANLQEHIEQCQLVPVACDNTCGRTDIPRNQMNQHVDADGDCPLAVVSCRYNDVGCKFKCRRLDMALHLQECMEQHLDMAHTRIRELEVRQENICMNGKFLWKITNYDHLMKQSATKKDKEKLCSPPFYTGQYGYKLRAEAFLNGLGQGKGSHLSLYVVIMKGEYDAILPWPFKQNVDFYLMDQDEDIANRQNKVWKLSCERNSDYFQRPTKSKSLGFGCPKFVSLETLKTRSYIRDQTLFIKIVVEPTDGLIFNAQTATH